MADLKLCFQCCSKSTIFEYLLVKCNVAKKEGIPLEVYK